MSSDDWDLIRIESIGGSPTGRNIRIHRNGEPIPGVKDFVLEASVDSLIKLTLTQYVRLEGPVTLEAAVQALEEREEIWDEEALGVALQDVFAANGISADAVISWPALAGAVLRRWKGDGA